jgi:hypothetical protein
MVLSRPISTDSEEDSLLESRSRPIVNTWLTEDEKSRKDCGRVSVSSSFSGMRTSPFLESGFGTSAC